MKEKGEKSNQVVIASSITETANGDGELCSFCFATGISDWGVGRVQLSVYLIFL